MILCLSSLASTVVAAPWTQTTSLPAGYAEHSLVYASGFLYQTGGFNFNYGESAEVFYSQVQSNGTIGAWNSATPLPAVTLDHAGVAANGFVYVLGGNYFTPDGGGLLGGYYTITNAVYYSQINPNGSLGTWQTANSLPQPAWLLSAAVWNNRIYAIGGYNGEALISNVYSAIIQADGSLSAWVTQRPLPDAIYAHAGVANGMLYVLGGVVNSGTTIQNKVYYAKINADGTLGIWNQTTPLPEPLVNFGAVAANGRVFVMAGSNGSSPTNGFYSAPVLGDGSLGSWSAGPALPRLLYSHAVAVTDSYIFLSGGWSNVQIGDAVYSMALPSPPAAPALTSQGFGTNGHFQLKLTSDMNTGFGILASTNLTDWTPIGTGFTDTNGVLSFEDANAASFPRRFYRAYWPLP